MAEQRVRIARDKSEFVKRLADSENSDSSIFNTYVDLLTFAASLGYKQGRKSPIEGAAKDPSPIRQDVFETSYSHLINLLAVVETKDPGILSNTEEAQKRRVIIFEEFANGGLEILEEKLRGSVDHLGTLALVVGSGASDSGAERTSFDLDTLIR